MGDSEISSRAKPEDMLKTKLKFAQAMISSAATSVVSSDFMLISMQGVLVNSAVEEINAEKLVRVSPLLLACSG